MMLESNCLRNHVNEWHISDDPPVSYHRHIRFQTGTTDPTRVHCASFEVTHCFTANFRKETYNVIQNG